MAGLRRAGVASVVCIVSAVFFGACANGGLGPDIDDGSGLDPNTCPIPLPGRALLEQAAMRSLVDLLLATQNASPGHRAVSHHILGRTWANIAFLTLAPAATCVGPDAIVFDPGCKSDVPGPPPPSDEFSATYDACSRGGCERAGVGFIDSYFTVKPARDPQQRHPFEYRATDPVGQMRYDPNPFVTTRYDLTNPGLIVVSAELRHRITFTPAGGVPLDVSHSGTLMATKKSGKLESTSLMMFFTGFTPPAFPVMLTIDGDASGEVAGSVRVGDRVLATVAGHFDPRATLFSWEGACAITVGGRPRRISGGPSPPLASRRASGAFLTACGYDVGRGLLEF